MRVTLSRIGLAAIVALAVFAAGFAGSGGRQVAHADPALVIDDFGCGVLDGDGIVVAADPSRSHAVVTQSNNGNTVVKCQVKDVANSSGQAVVWTPADFPFLPCNTPAGPTFNWRNTVSASGNVTLTCFVP